MFAAVGLVWIGLHAGGALGVASDLTFPLLGVGAITATVVGVRRSRPVPRWPFALFAAAIVCWLAGGGIRVDMQTVGDLSHGRSILPDLVTIPGYVLFGVGLAGLARARRGSAGADLDATLDAAIASLAVLAAAWAYLVTPALQQENAPLGVRVVLASYPPLSVFLVAMTLQIAFVSRARRPVAQRLILGAMASMLVGDVVYMLVDAQITSVAKQIVDVPYALAFLLFGTCLLHPSMRDLVEPVTRAERTTPPTRLVLVSLALGMPVVLLLVDLSAEQDADVRQVLGIDVALLAVLAIWRVFRALAAHARSEERLVRQATHDALTALPNRTYLNDYVEQALSRRAGTDRFVALLFLDVDRFKVVNDSMGHSLGDELLIAVARRLRGVVPRNSLIARIGGDEFVVVLDGVRNAEEAQRVADRVRESFVLPYLVRGADIYASASIGVAVSDSAAGTTVESLLRDADTAMYQAKDNGRDAVAVFDSRMRDRAAQRLVVERDLRFALRDGQLSVCYQPIVDMTSRRVIGLEALLRWHHPELGHIPPPVFIPIAEETGLIVEIGDWVLGEACRELASWRAELAGGRELYVAVNLSVRQLRSPELTRVIASTLDRHRLPGEALHLELTESMLLEHSQIASEVLQRLRERGVRIAIDDFGTGYSSLAYLRTLPVDAVKIDKSFIDDVDRPDSADASLVAAIVAVSKALGLQSTAEGVETPGQAERITELGVTSGQGYVWARPTPPDQVRAVVQRLNQLATTGGIEGTVLETA